MGSLYRKPTIWKRYKRAKNRNFSLNTQNINYQRIERKKKQFQTRRKSWRELDRASKSMPLPQLNLDDYDMDNEELEDVINKERDIEGGGDGMGDNIFVFKSQTKKAMTIQVASS
jgi:hypothetical protein